MLSRTRGKGSWVSTVEHLGGVWSSHSGGVRGACALLSGVMVALKELQVIGDVKGAAVLGSLGTE